MQQEIQNFIIKATTNNDNYIAEFVLKYLQKIYDSVVEVIKGSEEINIFPIFIERLNIFFEVIGSLTRNIQNDKRKLEVSSAQEGLNEYMSSSEETLQQIFQVQYSKKQTIYDRGILYTRIRDKRC